MKNNILVPLNNSEFMQQYIDAGADEFYMGFYDHNYEKKFGDFSEINRMSGFKHLANKYTFPEMLDVVKKVKDAGKPIFITLNAAVYSNAALEYIYLYYDKLYDAGADGVIISIPEMVKPALEKKLAPIASTMCGIYNSDIVDVYKRLGVSRMILPRDLSIAEIEDIIKKNPDVDYEVFLMRNGCRFSDSHCLGTHRPEHGSICHMLRSVDCNIIARDNSFSYQHDTELNHILYNKYYHVFATCGLCALFDFVKNGIKSYKIVGRADSTDQIVEDIRLVKKNIDIALGAKDIEDYLLNMIRIPNSYEGCKLGFGCYYPEIRF